MCPFASTINHNMALEDSVHSPNPYLAPPLIHKSHVYISLIIFACIYAMKQCSFNNVWGVNGGSKWTSTTTIHYQDFQWLSYQCASRIFLTSLAHVHLLFGYAWTIYSFDAMQIHKFQTSWDATAHNRSFPWCIVRTLCLATVHHFAWEWLTSDMTCGYRWMILLLTLSISWHAPNLFLHPPFSLLFRHQTCPDILLMAGVHHEGGTTKFDVSLPHSQKPSNDPWHA